LTTILEESPRRIREITRILIFKENRGDIQTKWTEKLMRYSENERETFKKRYKKEAQFQKRKENAIIAVRKDILLENINRLKLIIRKSIILKKNENEEFKKSLN
jgi:hypothetical protein